MFVMTDINEALANIQPTYIKSANKIPTFPPFISPDKENIRLHRLFVKRNYSECKEIINQILSKHNPCLCEYQLLLRGRIAREEGEINESLEWLTKSLINNPKSSTILYEIGKSYYLLAQHQKAIENFLKALEYDKTNWSIDVLTSCPTIRKSTDMLMFLARLLEEQNDLIAAVEAYKRCILMEPENVDLIHSLGMLYLKARSEDNAFSMLGKALTYDANYVPSILAIACILQNRGDYEVALSKYRIASVDFDHSGALWNNVGMCFFGRTKLIAAISCLNKANYLCPLDWKILYNLSMTYYCMKQYASAYHFISATFVLSPENPLILMTMALILTELKDIQNAKTAYKRALKLNPESVVIRINFAFFEYRCGNLVNSVKRLGPYLGKLNCGSEELDYLLNNLKEFFQKIAETNTEVGNAIMEIHQAIQKSSDNNESKHHEEN